MRDATAANTISTVEVLHSPRSDISFGCPHSVFGSCWSREYFRVINLVRKKPHDRVVELQNALDVLQRVRTRHELRARRRLALRCLKKTTTIAFTCTYLHSKKLSVIWTSLCSLLLSKLET